GGKGVFPLPGSSYWW
ncbi:hypothetical protein A2U01_0114544, partial [Trifolium medium]|nr:hypothetical protein [Trifolium medium]